MTTRRDFLKGFAALASSLAGLALAPASALASVQRLGTPAEWAEGEITLTHFHATFNVRRISALMLDNRRIMEARR